MVGGKGDGIYQVHMLSHGLRVIAISERVQRMKWKKRD